MDNNFEAAHDVIPLPSKGLFYKNKKESVKVSYLTAMDENLLTSPNLMQNGKVIDMLLDRKVIDKDLKPKDMLDGDRNAILFFLRSTGYGELYPIELVDPKTGVKFQHEFDLNTLKPKEINVVVDENGWVEFILPKSKRVVKFRYLSAKENEDLIIKDEDRMSKMGENAISQLLTDRLSAQIMSIDGVENKGEIEMFIRSVLSPMDSSELRKFMDKNEPGLDTNIRVKAPSGDFFFVQLPITTKFLWPYLNI